VGELFNQGNSQTLAEVWNGSTWSLQPTPHPSAFQVNTLNSVSCTAADACTAVGDSSTAGFGNFQTLAEVWDGTAWSLRSTPNRPGPAPNFLNGVSCGASQMCTAVGHSQNAAGIETTLILTGD